jgi:hypothetical protein
MPAGARCAVHSVGLTAKSPSSTGAYDTVHAYGAGDLIDGHSYLSGGNHNVSDVDSSGNTTTSNLQIYDSSIKDSVSDGLYLHSSGIKVSRNSISGAGTGSTAANNISVAPSANAPPPSDILISDNIIQEGKGWGLTTQGAHLIRVVSNYFDNNANQTPTISPPNGAVELGDGTSHVTLCGNVYHRTGSGLEQVNGSGPGSYHVYLAGRVDSISQCANVYFPGLNSNIQIPVRPDYNYNVASATKPTNISTADNPAPQNYGVYFPGADSLLQSSNVPQIPKSLSGNIRLDCRVFAA